MLADVEYSFLVSSMLKCTKYLFRDELDVSEVRNRGSTENYAHVIFICITSCGGLKRRASPACAACLYAHAYFFQAGATDHRPLWANELKVIS